MTAPNFGAGDLSVYLHPKAQTLSAVPIPHETPHQTVARMRQAEAVRRAMRAPPAPSAISGGDTISAPRPDNTISGAVYSGLQSGLEGLGGLFGESERDRVQNAANNVENLKSVTDDILGIGPTEKSVRTLLAHPTGGSLADYLNVGLAAIPEARMGAGRLAGTLADTAIGRGVSDLAASRVGQALRAPARYLSAIRGGPIADAEARAAAALPISSDSLFGAQTGDLPHARTPQAPPLAVTGRQPAPVPEAAPLALPAPTGRPDPSDPMSRFVVKSKGGEFVPSDIGEGWGYAGAFHSPEQVVQKTLDDATSYGSGLDENVANWFQKKGPAYLKNEFGTANDKLRDAVLSGGGHMSSSRPEQLWDDAVRQIYPMPLGTLTIPPHSSDMTANILSRQASDIARTGAVQDRDWSTVMDPMRSSREALLQAAPWLGNKMATDTMTMFGDRTGSKLGFMGLLRGAEKLTQPTANLADRIATEMPGYLPRDVANRIRDSVGHEFPMPPEIGIDPNKLGKMDLGDVSKKIGNFDQWAYNRATRAINEGLEKEYGPDLTNPAVSPIGLPSGTDKEWVQIKPPPVDTSGQLPEGYTISKPDEWARPTIYSPEGTRMATFSESDPSGQQEAIQRVAQMQAKNDTERALHAEGAFMRHCIGGYCDPVMSGEKNVYSLRDRAGKPSVSIETIPKTQTYTSAADQDPHFADVYNDLFYGGPNAQRVAPWDNRDTIMQNWVEQNRPDLAARYASEFASPAVGLGQIKGIHNSAPSAADRPAVIDFLRSQGPFSFAHTPDNSFEGHHDLGNLGLQLLPNDRIISTDKLMQGALDYANDYSANPLPQGAAGPLREEDMFKARNAINSADDLDEKWNRLAPYYSDMEEFAKGGLVVRRGHGGSCGCPDCGSALTVTRRAN